MNYAIVLAGGSGSRFWPLSRKQQPKQFLNLCSDQPMIDKTINRISRLIEKKNIYIATNKIYAKKIGACLAKMKIPRSNAFFEPQARNTFAPIALLTKKIYDLDKDAVVLVLPSDHYIKEEDKCLQAYKKAILAAQKGYIVTIGVSPAHPETGYGYIKVKQQNRKVSGAPAYKVEKFLEKPKIELAKKFTRNKNYYWNAGMFIFKAQTLLEEIKRLLPADYKLLLKTKSLVHISGAWKKFLATSIDYAIMERTKRSALIPADFSWSDLGSWLALADLLPRDKAGNISRGNCIDIGSSNILAWSDKKLLTTLGLKDLIVVSTNDAVLVCAKDQSQDVKKLVETLKKRKLSKLL